MNPEIYFRILLVTMAREGLVSAFAIIEALAQPGIVQNVGSQLIGYGCGVIGNRVSPFDPIKFLPPIISYAPQTYDFVSQVHGLARAERVCTLAYFLSGAGLLAKNGDAFVNVGTGGFIYLLAEYVASVTSSGGGGNILFMVTRPNRSLRQFTTKQHLQCQLAITGIVFVSIGSTYIIVLIARKVPRFVKAKLKKVKLKKIKNALTKSSKLKAKAIINRFKRKPKVKYIPFP